MEEIWNIKSFRNNLMIASLVTILIFIFSDKITKINFLWLIEITNINSIKLLVIILIINIYTFYRYNSYFMKMHFNLNYALLFKLILEKINLWKIKWTIKVNSDEYEKIELSSSWNILYTEKTENWSFKRKSDVFVNILSNPEIDCYLRSKKEIILINHNSTIEISLLKIPYKLIFLFYIFEKNVADYYLPFFLWSISIYLVSLKIILLLK